MKKKISPLLLFVIALLLALLLMPASVLYTTYIYYHAAHQTDLPNNWQNKAIGSRFFALAEIAPDNEPNVALAYLVSPRPYRLEVGLDTVLQQPAKILFKQQKALLSFESMLPKNQIGERFPYLLTTPQAYLRVPQISRDSSLFGAAEKKISLQGRPYYFALRKGDRFVAEFEVIGQKPFHLHMKNPLVYGSGTYLWDYYLEQNTFFVVIASILFLFASFVWSTIIVNKIRKPKKAHFQSDRR